MADVAYNTQNICKMIDETVAKGAKVIVFPELCVTGYTCSDLFTQDILLKESKEALFKIAEYTKEKDAIIFIGVPLAIDGELYNVAAALNHGEILGLTTKTFLPAPVRAVYTSVQAIRYIVKGIHCLVFKRKLHVEVLDATAISVSLLRRDFNTAGGCMVAGSAKYTCSKRRSNCDRELFCKR
ncbi:MAG: hypothetical protein BHW17_04520 [Dorea sp. 42_8]|nr:MAG: hypothetical protein BHW17_04520 [Dorea sp. 42_8]